MYEVFASTGLPPEHHWLILPLLKGHLGNNLLTASEIHRQAKANRGPALSRPQTQTILERLSDTGYVINEALPGKAGRWRLSQTFLRALAADLDRRDGS